MVCTPATGTTWQWYRNGIAIPGATSSTCYAYDAASYTVMVGGCPSPSAPLNVTIKPLPLVSVFSTTNTLCSGQDVTLFVTTGPNVTWVWINPPSLFGLTTNPVNQTVTTTTTFQVVGADQTTNCANTAAVTVLVFPVLTSGTVQSDVQICPGNTPPLITSTPAIGGNGTYTYQWQISTTSATTGFSDIPGATGSTYQPGPTLVTTWYRLVTSSPPCPDEFSNSVVVQVNPNPAVTSAPAKTICSGSNVNYVPTSNVAGATFTWTASVTSGSVSGFTPSGSGNINDILSLPAGSSTQATVTYVITPAGPAPSSCVGIPMNLVVTVVPVPIITNAVLSQDICAGATTTPVILTSNVASTSFNWTATAAPGLSGYLASGSGNIPAMQIFSSLLTAASVTYTITPSGPAPSTCTGSPVTYTINVNPSPSVTNSPMQQTICTGSNSTAVTLTSNIVSTTFTWTATAVPTSVSGYQASGTNSIPVQNITNPSNVQGVVTYHIIPSGSINGCLGVPTDYLINVNPVPVATATPASDVICSGSTTNISLSSTVTGTTFNWTASGPGVLSGFSNGSGNTISQTITNGSNAPHDVTYIITPTAGGCPGTPIVVVVTVNPANAITSLPLSQTICSGATYTMNLTATLPGTSFSWTVSGAGVTGYSNGSGNTISQTLTNATNVPHNAVYLVTGTLNGCITSTTSFTVTVNPLPVLTNSPLTATQCSGTAFNVAFTSNLAGTTYTWTANGTPGISGYSGGNSGTINQTLINSSNAPGTVTYSITPSANGCAGIPVDYTVTVNPRPSASLSLANQSICSGTPTTAVTFSSAVAGTTYTWTASPSGAGITGYSASGSVSIPSQTINSTLSVPGTVTYTVTPAFSGCNGSTANHVVTINPLPLVTNATMSQTICTGTASANVNLLSNVAGTTFSWIATPSSAAITGFQASGSNTIPSQTLFNSSATSGSVTYQIIPTSNFGPNCPGTPANYIITVDPSPSVTSSLNSAVCSGQPFNYTITSNLPSTTFTWSRSAVAGISNPSASGSSALINETLNNTTNFDIDVQYVLTPTGQAPAFCAGSPVTLTVKVRALPQVNAGPDVTIPYGTYTTLNGTASGGTGALTYTWTPNSYITSGATTLTPQTINLTSTRSYTLTVDDAMGCSLSDQMTVFIVGGPIAVAPDATPANICVGESTVLNANATGGSGTYTYSWTSVPAGFTSTSSTVNVSPTTTTIYTVTADDGFNTATASTTVTVNPLPAQFVLTGGGSYCTGSSGVVVGLAGSQSGVTYQLLNNGNPTGIPVFGTGTPISFGNQTAAGTYTVSATRVSTGCTQDMGSSVSVSINALPVADAGVDQFIPHGTNTTLNGSVSGGFGAMNYSWNPAAFIASGATTSAPATTNLYSNTTFTLNVTDANGCTGTDQMTVSLSGSAINVVAASLPDEICADTSQAQLHAVVTGGAGTYTFSWTCSPAGSPAWTSTQQDPFVSPDVTTIYTVTADDGFNTAVASATIVVHPLPLQYSVTGGGSYCFAGSGVSIGLSGSEFNTNYQLFRGGVPDGPPVTGNGTPISFGNRTAAFNYTVMATNNITGCSNMMNGSATIIILPPPSAYLVTGGGSYPLGGPGREVGLMHGDNGVSYQLYCNNVATGAPVLGSGTSISFGLQTQAGTYTAVGTDIVTGCTANMHGSVNITILPLPLIFNVIGGGMICQGQPGYLVALTGSESGINYQLLLDGFPFGPLTAGTNSSLTWGPLNTGGMYEVRAINPSTGSTQMMNDSAVIIIKPSPTVFTINPTGSQCPGTILRLNGSDAGVMYYLMLNGITIDSLAGTGVVGFLDFGPQTMNGTYTINAVNITTGCQNMMNGSMYINVSPQVFNVIPAGILCPGQVISLTGSQVGVNYQLRWNGTFDLGAPVAGTGSAIVLGTAGMPGIYSAIAIDATTNCVTYMSDSSTLYPDPTAFTIIPDGTACEGDIIGLNGSEIGVDYVLVLDNAIHLDTISGNGFPISFGPQLTEGNYTILAIDQTSYCQFNMNGTTVMNDSPIKYSLIPAGLQCIGTTIGLSNSQAGITYQLLLDGLYNMGSPVAGTGSAITFGPQTLSGIYTVRAVNNITGCNSLMADSAIIEPLPVIFTSTPSGSHCAGTSIVLNGSEINFNYILVLDGTINLDTIAGTGNAIDFGPQATAGTYTVTAYNTTSFCDNPMNGSTIIEAAPVAFDMTPAGIACEGTVIGLENSETGISYQLRWNGSINIGMPVIGNGAAISFGAQSLTGVYSVIATNADGCFTAMSSSVTINALPVAFNLIPSGTQCQGTSLGLDGSEVNASYILVLNGNMMVDTIAGTGSTISFGPQMTSGTYTVVAFFNSTNCQSTMNGSSVISNVAPAIYSMMPAGIICSGATIGLNNSEIGAFYQLRLNGTINMGVPVAGTGSAIDFGVQTLAGVYTAIATNANGCSSVMTGNVVVNPNPTAFSIIPTGSFCPGSTLGTDGSETGVNYILVLDGSINIDTISGNGAQLSFGAQTTSGVYTVVAYNTTTLCHTIMNGTTVIIPAPVSFNMTPAGIICAGSNIGLDNSEIGVTYQLRLNGTVNVGAPVAGTGSQISFGAPSIPGAYSVVATNASNCSSMMNDTITLNPMPTTFSILPSGVHCQGTSIGVDGSETGVNYVLVLNNTIYIDTIAGNGSAINFGPQSTSGVYTVSAYTTVASCAVVMNGNTTINPAPFLYNMTPAGIICSGATLGIDGSNVGVNYQLRRNGTINVGSPVTGTGSAISFGIQTVPGTYTVEAAGINGCTAVMNGTIVMNASPIAFTQFPAGSHCPGTIITLNGSETGINYILYRDGIFPVDTIEGTGLALSFGTPMIAGTYTVTATSSAFCQTAMNGSTTILLGPTSYNVTPAGILCTGSAIGLDDSEIGVNYQLRRDGITNVGTPLAGTGFPISFGIMNIPGTYTVIATSTSTGCGITMNGSPILQPQPLVYTIAPQGPQCSGVSITLNGSQLGTDYVLVLDNTFNIDTIPGTGNTLDFGPQLVTGTYTVQAIGGATTCQAAMNGSTQVLAYPATFNITPAGLICATATVGLDGSETGVNYTLYKNGISTGITVPGTGNAISFGIQLWGDFTVKAVNQLSNCSIFMPGMLQISIPPQVNAGADVTICANQIAFLNATVSNGGASLWSTTGDGSFNNTSSLNAVYTPGATDIAAGTVSLLLTVDGTGTCASIQVTDTIIVTIDPVATVNAGGNIDVCTPSDYTISGATATNYNTITWSTSGTGSFINGNTISPTYVPSAADLAAGSVNLSVLVTGNLPCTNAALGVIVMTFHPMVTANAGIDDQICAGNTFTVTSASVLNNQNLSWSTTGSGTFTGGNTLTPTYTPGAADITAGNVSLIISATSVAPCSVIAADTMVLSIIPAPVSNAGADISICENTSLNIIDASVSNVVSMVWSTSGTGTFSNAGIVNPIYTPSVADIASGSVMLTLTVTGNALCAPAIDQKLVTFVLNPIVNAGADTHMCTTPFILSGATSANCASTMWTVQTGTGTLLNANTLTPTYTASAADIANGFVILGLTGTPQSPCVNSVSDFVTLMIDQVPVANAGTDIATCDNSAFTINDAAASLYSTLNWTTSGTGTFINASTLNPTYTPSTGDVANGSVILTLTASNAGCGSVSDNKLISFINQTTVNAGPDVTICEGSILTIGGASANAYSSISWTTSGTGILVNANTITPTYTPSLADITNGTVTLTLSAVSIAPCNNVISDQAVLTIQAMPVVWAGDDVLICSNDIYMNDDAFTLNCATLTWSSSGTGTFSNPNSLVNTYTPSAADIAAGSVMLTLTTSSNAPCPDVTDQKQISFFPGPVANAGPGATICTSCSFVASAATTQNSTNVQWSTTGSGSFNNTSLLNTTYTPSAADYAQGSVVLSLTAFSTPPCTQVVDTMTLIFSNTPGIDFTWGASCESQPVAFSPDASVTNIGAVATWLWNFGDGNTSGLMNPSHLFAGLGNYTVTLTAIDTNGFAKVISHVITITQPPVSFFSYSIPNCSNEEIILTDLSYTLYGNIAEWVWNYGDGSPNDTIMFPNEPNRAHLFNAAGTFNVTLSIINSFGCKASLTIPVEVIEAPIANFQYTNNCSDLVTSFQDASYANGPGNTVQYWWEFGDPATGVNNYSNLKDPTHLFTAPGTYQVMHIVRNFNNCSDTIIKPVTILTPVPVDFVYDHTCVNGTTNFSPDTTVMNVADITGWAWDFGDGVTNYQQYTSHSYSGPGTYQVKLTVTDISGCTASKTRTVVVNPLPVAMFNVAQLPCANEATHFDDVSTTYAGYIVKWNWDFGDGNTQQILHPANADTDHTYSIPGTYTVKLTITSSDSCTAERTETIVINPAPTVNFDFENSCQGTPVQFTDLTQNGGTGAMTGWSWNFGDNASGGSNSSTLQNPTHTYTTSGTYQVSLTVSTANGCSATLIKPVTITVAPFVDFSYDNHCVSSNILFTPATSVNMAQVATWNWSFGDGTTSTLPNPQHTYNTPGNYLVTLTISNTTGCQNTISHTITILPAPVANFSTSAPACSQHLVNFTNHSSAAVGYIMRWEYNFGDGASMVVNYPANPNVSHTYSTYGSYNVTLTVVTNDSCSATTSRNVQILQSPLANFDYDVTCSGMPVQFTDLSQGNLVTWSWNFGDSGSGANNTSNLQNPVHTYQQAGNYVVLLLIGNANGCTDTVSRTLNISPKPVVDFSFVNGCAADTVHFISSTFVNVSATTSWLWQFGDNSISTEVDPYHVYLTPGTYNVSLTITNQNGCTNVKTRQIQVTTAPIALYSSTTPNCSGTAVLFTDMSSTPNGTISSWNWNFGDGTILNVNAPANPNVSHTYASAGIYDVVLTIHTSTGCEAFYTTSVTINDAPVTAFSFEGSCSGIPTLFTDLSQSAGLNSIVSWTWEFGDPASGMNNISNLPDPQHIFNNPGTYSVSLTTENSTGCTNTLSQILTITPKPAVDFVVSPSCVGMPVTFNVDPTITNIAEVASYLWDFGDGTATSSQASPEHLYAQAGNYNTTLVITNLAGCENSVTHVVTVHAVPVAQFTSTGNCTANLVQFTDLSYNPDGEEIVGWSWDFGVSTTSGDTSSIQNPTYVYTTGGTYNVTLTITSASGCTSVIVMPVTLIPAPAAQYSYVAEPCHNGAVIFMDESTSAQSPITGWYWEFAPGVYSTLQNPVHVYGASDTCYNVKLVVTTANGCTDTLVKEVCIPAGMEVTIDFTETCFGEPTWFVPTLVQPAGGTISFYNWNFGDQATGIYNESKLSNPQHTFSKPGTYIVSLQAYDNNNCSTTTYKTVVVSPLPVSAFSHKGGVCDSLVSFKNLTTGAPVARWTWNFGDGNTQVIDAPANPDVNHYYPYPGIYNVTLITESDAGCRDTITRTIRRTPCIAAEFAVNDTIVCQKRRMHFTETSTCQAPIASWQWFFGDNTSVTYTTPQPYVEHTYAIAGNYTVKMVVATQMVGGMVTDTASSQVSVKPAATAAYKWQDVCIGSKTEFENLTNNNNTTITGYQWNFGDPGSLTDTTSAKHPEYTYNNYGEYDVKLVVTNTLGCSDTIVNKVYIFENPVADFKWNSGCAARPVEFTDNSDSTSSAISEWNWLFSNADEVLGASTEPNCTFSFTNAGIYDANLKITDHNGCSTTVTKQIAINSSPVAAFSIVENYENKQGQIMLSNGTLNGTNYEWDFGNGQTSFAMEPVTTYDKEGRYNIKLITWNGQNCADTLTLPYELLYKGLFVPNAFVPGHIDPEVAVFRPKGTNLKSYYIEILDRWGNLLWSSSKLDAKGSPAESWDGTLHGELLKQDVYLWRISAQFRDGEIWDGHNAGNNTNMPQSKTGTVTLIR